MSAAPAPRRAGLAWIWVTVVLDVLSFGVVIPVFPKLIESFLAGDTGRAAQVYGVFAGTWALAQLLCSPILGALSDRFGRRPVLLLSNFGLGIDYVLMALAPSLGWLFAGRVITGICGASYTTAAAYVADVTEPGKRAAAYGRIGAAWGLGFVLGPALGGFLGETDPRLPFWVAAALTVANACWGFFVLPESLPKERRAPLTFAHANPLGSLGLVRERPALRGLVSATTLYWLAHYVLPSVLVLYASRRYAWSARTVGLTLTAVGVCNVIVQAGLVRRIVARFGERRAAITGQLAGAAGFVIYGLAPTAAWFWAGIPVFAFMGLNGPSMQSLMTRRVGADQQGRLQGVNGSVMGLTGIVGPPLFTNVFAAAIAPSARMPFPGAPFVLAAVILVAAALVTERATRVASEAFPGAS